jgi:hypothetical protein
LQQRVEEAHGIGWVAAEYAVQVCVRKCFAVRIRVEGSAGSEAESIEAENIQAENIEAESIEAFLRASVRQWILDMLATSTVETPKNRQATGSKNRQYRNRKYWGFGMVQLQIDLSNSLIVLDEGAGSAIVGIDNAIFADRRELSWGSHRRSMERRDRRDP